MTVFTIGYEGLTPESFMAWLKRFDISFVADVRHLPLSRKKGFSKTVMSETLGAQNIVYENYRELGTSKEMREKLYQSHDYKDFFSKYTQSLEDKTEYIGDLLSNIHKGHKVALLCFERDAAICHRKVLAEQIKKMDGNGMEIKHIKPIS